VYNVQCCNALTRGMHFSMSVGALFLITYMPFQDVTPQVAVEEEEGEGDEDVPNTSTATSTPRQEPPRKRARKSHGSGTRFAQLRVDLESKYTKYIEEQKTATQSKVEYLSSIAAVKEKNYNLRVEKFEHKKQVVEALLREKVLDRQVRERKIAVEQERNRILSSLLPRQSLL